MFSEAKLTALTTTTLSLLLERQRLQATHPSLHLAQIVTNLRTLRNGVVALQDVGPEYRDSDGDDGVAVLRGQYERLRGMLGEEEADKAGLASIPLRDPVSPSGSPSPPPTPTLPETREHKESLEPVFEPYTDDPRAASDEGIALQQRQIIQDQDAQLDHLSSSIHRQHHISLQINDELEVHTGLLHALDTELDGTDGRMTGARRQLARVARGAKDNASTVTIGLLILVLLVLIVIFKT